MGIHFVVDNLVDGEVDRLAPEALSYEPGPGDSLSLTAAEYLALADAWDAALLRSGTRRKPMVGSAPSGAMIDAPSGPCQERLRLSPQRLPRTPPPSRVSIPTRSRTR